MAASRFLRFTVAVLGFGLGTAVLAADPDDERKKEEEIRRLREILAQQRLIAEQLRLGEQQKQKAQPKAPPPKPLVTVPAGTMPAGAVARLGDGRLRHAAAATCVAFSPDGRRLVTGGADGALRVWDVATGEAADSVLSPGSTVAVARFTHNGTRIAAAFSNSRLQFLNPDTLKEEAAFTLGYGNEFAVSEDGKLIAGIGASGALVVSELGTDLEKLEVPVQSAANTLFAFPPGGKTVAVGERSGKVTVYKLAGGKPVLSFDHGGPLNGLAFSPDGKRAATGGTAPGEVLKVWDVTDTKKVTAVAEVKGVSQPRAWVGADRVAAAGGGGAGVYDLAAGKWAAHVKAAGGEWAVSADGTKLAAAGAGALRVRMWDLDTGKQLHAENDTFPDAALLAPTPDGKAVFVLAADAAFLWPVGSREAAAAGTLPGRTLAAATGGGRLAVALPQGVAVYDDFDPAKPLPGRPARTVAESAPARSVAVSQDGKKLAYSADNGGIVVADAATGKAIRSLPTQTVGLAMTFSPDGKRLAVVGRDGFLRLWASGPLAEKEDDNDLWRVRVARGPRAGVAFSPDGKLVTGTAANLIVVADAATGDEAFKLDRRDFDDGIFQQLAFSPDSRLLLTGSGGLTGAVHVWEVATRSLVRRYATGLGAVNRLAVFPDGGRAVSAGAEEVITAWDLTFRHGKAAPTADELVGAWAALDDLDAATGYPALRTLAAGGVSGVRTVAAGLQESLDTQKKIARWVKELGSDEFADREAATKALLEQGFQALPAVTAAAARAESPEVRTRAADLVTKLTAKGVVVPAHGLAGDALRLVRAVRVLEEVGGPEAKALLTKIADIGGRAGDEAKAALKRVE